MAAPVFDSLPLVLAYGYVAVYGNGVSPGIQGFPAASGWKFGEIVQVSPGLPTSLEGDSVMFKETEVRCRISYLNYPYTIVEQAKIVFTENPLT